MTWVSWSVSLTLVLAGSFAASAYAAPTDEIDLYKKTKQVQPEEPATPLNLDEKKLSLTPPPPGEAEEKSESLYYPYRQSMSPRVGVVVDPDLMRDNGEFPMIFGISYMFPRSHSPQVELSFDILTNSKAHISGMLRRIFNERESFRPYIKGGVCVQADGDERLTTFSKWKNYFVRGSLGFEDVISMPMSVRIELEFAASSESQMAIVNFGYSWGW